MEQNCYEQILDDVVRVDLVPASACQLPVPFQVSGLTEMSVADGNIGAATLSLAYSVQDGDDGEIDSAPVLKQSEKAVAAGVVVSHDLQVPVTAGFRATREAVSGLQTADFHALLTTSGGDRYLLYALPNTSRVSLEEQGINQQSTVKVVLQSMSHVILLTPKS